MGFPSFTSVFGSACQIFLITLGLFVAYQFLSPLFSLYSGIWSGLVFIKDVILRLTSVRITGDYSDIVKNVTKDVLTTKLGFDSEKLRFEEL